MHEREKWKWSHSVVSDSSRPHGLQPTRLLRPWDFPGKRAGVGCHCLLWGLWESHSYFSRKPCELWYRLVQSIFPTVLLLILICCRGLHFHSLLCDVGTVPLQIQFPQVPWYIASLKFLSQRSEHRKRGRRLSFHFLLLSCLSHSWLHWPGAFRRSGLQACFMLQRQQWQQLLSSYLGRVSVSFGFWATTMLYLILRGLSHNPGGPFDSGFWSGYLTTFFFTLPALPRLNMEVLVTSLCPWRLLTTL